MESREDRQDGEPRHDREEILESKFSHEDFLEACEYGNLDLVKKYIRDIKALRDPLFRVSEGLNLACECGQESIVKFLVRNYCKNRHDLGTAAIYASKTGHLKILSYLHAKGANLSLGENSAVFLANENKHYETVDFLLKNGAILSVENSTELMISLIPSCLKTLSKIKDKKTIKKNCCVCIENEAVVVFNCGHKETCAACSILILQKKLSCPICREEIIFATGVYEE